jgi:hypothetical protein
MFEKVKSLIAEVTQSRSEFQIEKFVIGQHATPEMQFYQVMLELQTLIYSYEHNLLEREKAILEIQALELSDNPIEKITAKQKKLGLEQLEVGLQGHERELTYLLNKFDSFEHYYTRKEIEEAQPDYWEKRLTNNARAMIMGGQSVGFSYIESMEQAGILDKFVAEIEKQKESVNDLRSLPNSDE